jgi:hypothetical protein
MKDEIHERSGKKVRNEELFGGRVGKSVRRDIYTAYYGQQACHARSAQIVVI